MRWVSRRTIFTGRALLSKGRSLTNIDAKADYAERNSRLFAASQQSQPKSNVYPLLSEVKSSKAQVIRIPEFKTKWNDLPHDPQGKSASKSSHNPHETFVIHGRIHSIRRAGKSLIFLDITQDFEKVQVVVNKGRLIDAGAPDKDFLDIHASLRRGDIIQVQGFPGRTQSGELSIMATEQIKLLSPCLHPLPEHQKLSNTTRLHNRVVDLLTNPVARDVLRARATIIREIRRFFETQGFIEVQTPMISTHASGATAEPFRTNSRALSGELSQELCLRIAPELWLKRLTVAGFDKVFEIGQCFRNEGIDATHNPEFTTCEFYKSFADLDELVSITESLLQGIATAVSKEFPQFAQHAAIFPNAPFQRLDFISTIEKAAGIPLPLDLSDSSALYDYAQKSGVSLPERGLKDSFTSPKLLDLLAGHFIEPLCTEPTFIMNHPSIMSPLSKCTTIDVNGRMRTVSRRLELFVNGREYVNAYEEENSPFSQKEKFDRQALDHSKDSEVPLPDLSYVSAMEWGLPPTGGWGLGIDRLCMLFTGSDRIANVLAFGGVKVVNLQ